MPVDQEGMLYLPGYVQITTFVVVFENGYVLKSFIPQRCDKYISYLTSAHIYTSMPIHLSE